jgi:Flp pilus assembly protein TadB
MTVDRDPNLQDLFDAARQDVPERPFVADVMSQVDIARRKAVIVWIGIGLALIALLWLLAAPAQVAVQLLAQAFLAGQQRRRPGRARLARAASGLQEALSLARMAGFGRCYAKSVRFVILRRIRVGHTA